MSILFFLHIPEGEGVGNNYDKKSCVSMKLGGMSFSGNSYQWSDTGPHGPLFPIFSNLSKQTILFCFKFKHLQPKSQILTTPKEMLSENIVGKGENTDNQHFLLSHNVFNPVKDKNYHFS